MFYFLLTIPYWLNWTTWMIGFMYTVVSLANFLAYVFKEDLPPPKAKRKSDDDDKWDICARFSKCCRGPYSFYSLVILWATINIALFVDRFVYWEQKVQEEIVMEGMKH